MAEAEAARKEVFFGSHCQPFLHYGKLIQSLQTVMDQELRVAEAEKVEVEDLELVEDKVEEHLSLFLFGTMVSME